MRGRHYARRRQLIDTADPDDPIARQFIPDPAELMVRPEELADPIGDDVHSPVEGSHAIRTAYC